MTIGGSVMNLFANPREAQATLSADLIAPNGCAIGGSGANPVPVMCFDLAGGANIAGSNALVYTETGGSMSTAGYSKLGLPGDMVPGGVEPTASATGTSNGDFTDSTLGSKTHSDSAILRGILARLTDPAARGRVNGSVIAARSDNDTGNNPHNPMYGIAKAGMNVAGNPDPVSIAGIVTLIGSRNSESGGNSMAPASMIDAALRPTKVDRASDVTGLVDTGNLTGILSDRDDVVAVMESISRISKQKLGKVDTGLDVTNNQIVKDLLDCGYLKAADIADRFAGRSINPVEDGRLVDGATGDPFTGTGIFTTDEVGPTATSNDRREFEKTASVVKMLVDGHAGVGTVTMGGYDYHTGTRGPGETRDFRAGQCIGAALQYAAHRGAPIMIYVFSDGSVASNGAITDDGPGRGKPNWTGDNSSTACSWMLYFDPNATPEAGVNRPNNVIREQIGWFRSDASVDTSSSAVANNVNLLAEAVVLNYLALQGREGEYGGLFGGLGTNVSALAPYIAFPQLQDPP